MDVSTSGGKLFTREWMPEPISIDKLEGVVFICHGFAEHSAWYEELGTILATDGYLCVAQDHLHHGKSDGQIGHIDNMQVLVDDVLQACRNVKSKYPGKKLFLIGHSMGGLIAVLAAIENRKLFDGIILIAPLLRMPSISNLKIWIGKCLASLWPTSIILPAVDANLISRDSVIVEQYRRDELNYHNGITAKTGQQFLQYVQKLDDDIEKLITPTLCLHSKNDAIVPIEAAYFLRDRAINCKDKYLVEFQDAYHQLHHELPDVKQRVFSEISIWLNNKK